MKYSQLQIDLIEAQLDSVIFLSGPAGSGKTSVGKERLKFLLDHNVPGNDILVLVPQRNLSTPYYETLTAATGSTPVIATYGGLARRIIDLFWPVILSETNQFSQSRPPIFLTLESSLYFLSKIVDPLIDDHGLFTSVTIQRNRLYSQILDNLNKAAVHGFSHKEISQKLKSAWIGDPVQMNIFDDAQVAASDFRDFCLQNSLLDYSLQIELFTFCLDHIKLIKQYFYNNVSHLIYDNCEEDIPVSHDFVSTLLPHVDSALIIFDQDAGYRQFLGASPASARELRGLCQTEQLLDVIYTSSSGLQKLNNNLIEFLHGSSPIDHKKSNDLSMVTSVIYKKQLPQLSARIAEVVNQLLQEGADPSDIAILAPYLSDTLRFFIVSELEKHDIPYVTHRPSRALRDEPVSICMLTLAALAHQGWASQPSIFDISLCLMQSISELDLTRANLLAKQIHSTYEKSATIPDFDSFPGEIQERISYFNGSKYQYLVDWIRGYQKEPVHHLDHFMMRIFDEVLTRSGFGFQENFNKAEITEHLIESIRKFRDSAGMILGLNRTQIGAEYFGMVRSGVLASQYLSSWNKRSSGHVYISPAYTFLLHNNSIDYQFWLDVGSRGWYERIYQPLTNPHVLHRDWEMSDKWSDANENEINHDNLSKIITGLTRRCNQKIYFCLSDTDEYGFEQKGLLIQAINNVVTQSVSFPEFRES